MTMTRPLPFFIMGCPRSGTTLVAQLLDSHSRIAVLVESLYYKLFHDILQCYGNLASPKNTRRLFDDLIEMLQLRNLHRTDLPSTDELMAELQTASFQGILSTFLQLYARQQGKVRAGEKTARHYDFLPQILDEFPDSPVIFIMRDPRDVMVSVHKMFGMNVHRGIVWWNNAFEQYKYLEKHARSACLVRYEDLVHDPQSSLEKLCDCLGESYEPDMLRFFERVPEKLAGLTHHSKLASRIASSSVGNFHTLTDAQIAVIEAACAAGMDALGYSPAGIKIGEFVDVRPPHNYPIVGKLQRLYRVIRRPDLRYLGWRRWKMRQRARIRHAVRSGAR